MASTEHIWKYANHSTQSILFLGHANDPAWHWGHVNSVSATFKKQIPHIHGGFCYIRASEHKFIEEFFAFCRETFWNYDLYNCKRWYKGNGMTDEIIFAIAFAQFDLNPIDFDELPVMTFNVTEVPTCRQTEGGNCRTMSGYIPFNHTFSFKYGSMKHALVFNRIMKRGAKAKVLSVCINILCGAA